MGDPRKTRKHFKRPLKIWSKANIEREKALKVGYGLKNKREIWKTETLLRKKRHSARSLLALPLEKRIKRENELLGSLSRLGILSDKAVLDDVLTLNVESFLERRLQTLAWRKGLANTAVQARQFVVHGHVAIDGKRVTAPSYLVSAEEESKIGYYAGKKMVLKPAEKDVKKAAGKKESVKEAFEAAKPEEPEQNAANVLEAIRAVRKQAKGKGEKPEGKEAEKAVEEEAEEGSASGEEDSKKKPAAEGKGVSE